jgi:hypothetical protein
MTEPDVTALVEDVRRRHQPFSDMSGCKGCDTWGEDGRDPQGSAPTAHATNEAAGRSRGRGVVSPLNDWHGWSAGGDRAQALHIGHLPGRRSVALYTEGHGTLNVLAYFRSEQDAEVAMLFIDRIANSMGYVPASSLPTPTQPGGNP